MIKRILLPVFIILAAVGLVALLMHSKPKPNTKPQVEKSWSVSSRIVHFQTYTPQVELFGVVEATRTSQLSASTSAFVKQVLVQEGDKVKKGELLIQLDPSDVQLSVQQRQAQVASIHASITEENNRYLADKKSLKDEIILLKLAQKSINRQRKLAKSRLTSEELIDKTRNDAARQSLNVIRRLLAVKNHSSRLMQLKAKLKQSQAQLKASQLNVNRTRIIAPFNGYITKVNASPGDRARPGETLVTVYDIRSLEVRAQIPNSDIHNIRAWLQQGQTLSGYLTNNPGVRFKISRLSASSSQRSGGVDAFLEPDTTDSSQSPSLIVGDTVSITLNLLPQKYRFSAPVSALYGNKRIYIIKQGRIRAQQVEVTGRYFIPAPDSRSYLTRLILKPASSDSMLIKEGQRFITTQLPSAISGLKITDRSASTKAKQ